jgi:hypothetical protein
MELLDFGDTSNETGSTKQVMSERVSVTSSIDTDDQILISPETKSPEILSKLGHSNDTVTGDNKRILSDKKISKKKSTQNHELNSQIAYHGVNINMAASQGSLPLCVLLWGMAAARRINLMTPDSLGNNPLHYAAIADTPEVFFFIQLFDVR